MMRAGAPCLRDAINAYRTAHKDSLDQAALDLLDRVAVSSDAAKAFKRLKLKRQYNDAEILTTCTQADQLARTLRQRITKAEKTLGLAQVERLDRAVATLRAFVDELVAEEKETPAFDLLSAGIPADNIGAMNSGLYFIARRINEDRRVAKEAVLRLGATQKKGATNAVAPENAAIGWLAEGVRRVTGKPHLAAVRDLAQVMLQTDLSEDRVCHAARLRYRGWRQP